MFFLLFIEIFDHFLFLPSSNSQVYSVLSNDLFCVKLEISQAVFQSCCLNLLGDLNLDVNRIEKLGK